MLDNFKADIKRYLRDSGNIYLIFEQGLWAIAVYRFGRSVRKIRIPVVLQFLKLVAYLLFKFIEILTGISLPVSAEIGKGFYVGHFGGIILHSDVKIGENCSVGPGVVIGTRGLGHQGAPIIGNNVYIGVGAKILRGVKYSILNRDDASFKYLISKASGKIVTYGINSPADYTPNNTKFKTGLLGIFNQYNCLAAAAAAKLIGIDDEIINSAIHDFPGVTGRMEEIKTDKRFKIYIDFAHKINALKNSLSTARKLTVNKLIVVFGCAGLRDHLKRPIMGEVAAELADYAILTAEDPRTEDVREIIKQIAEGCIESGMLEADKSIKDRKDLMSRNKYFWRIPDRQQAVNFAVRKLSGQGDVILICGKGHEQSMCYGNTEYPWDERRAVYKALYGAGKKATKI